MKLYTLVNLVGDKCEAVELGTYEAETANEAVELAAKEHGIGTERIAVAHMVKKSDDRN